MGYTCLVLLCLQGLGWSKSLEVLASAVQKLFLNKLSPFLNLGEQRWILKFNCLCNVFESVTSQVHLEPRQLISIADMLLNQFILGAVEGAFEEFNYFVLNALIERQLGTAVCMQSNHCCETTKVNCSWLLLGVFDAVVEHLDQHGRVISHAYLELQLFLQV